MTDSKSWYDKLKTGAKNTYSKGKAFTEKQIHDAKKKVALNVLDATKKKTPKNERNIITNAKRILAKRYETGGGVSENNYRISISENDKYIGEYPDAIATLVQAKVIFTQLATKYKRPKYVISVQKRATSTSGMQKINVDEWYSYVEKMKDGGNIETMEHLENAQQMLSHALSSGFTRKKWDMIKDEIAMSKDSEVIKLANKISLGTHTKNSDFSDLFYTIKMKTEMKMAKGGNIETKFMRLVNSKDVTAPEYNYSSLTNIISKYKKQEGFEITFEIPKVAKFIITYFGVEIIPIGNLKMSNFREGTGTNFDASVLASMSKKTKHQIDLTLNLLIRNCCRAALCKSIDFKGLKVNYHKSLIPFGFQEGEHLFDPSKNHDDFNTWVQDAPRVITSRGVYSIYLPQLEDALEQLNNLLPEKIMVEIKTPVEIMKDGGNIENKAVNQLAEDEKSEGYNAEVFMGKFDGKTFKAQSTDQTWADGVPVMKYFTRGGFKDVKLKGEYQLVDSDRGWWYVLGPRNRWYAIKRNDYGTPPFEYAKGGMMATGGGVDEHTSPTLIDMCTITVEGDIKTQPKWDTTYRPAYENDLIQLRVHESSSYEDAYDVQVISRNKYWWEFSPRDMRKRSKPYVDALKTQVGLLLQDEGIKLKSFKMVTNRVSMETGGKVGKKLYNQMFNVGRSKYVVNYHDGEKTYKDGSAFFDVAIFKNKVDLNKFIDKLHKEGYVQGYGHGGGIGSLAPNLLMELWFAVWERKTDKYSEIGAKLDKEGVSFSIQNQVSADAEKSRSRKAIDTFEVKDRIEKIMSKNMMAQGGLTEHGLKLGDKIVGVNGKEREIIDIENRGKKRIVNLETGKRTIVDYGKGGSMYEDGGVVGQEIVFDDSGEENTGVIAKITDNGDYVVSTDDGRTVLAQREMDVIELRGMRKKAAPQNPRKLFGFFDEGGNIEDMDYVSNIAMKWEDSDVITNDLKKYLIESYNTGGYELVNEIVMAIQRGITEGNLYVDDMETGVLVDEIDPDFELTRDDQMRLEGWCDEIREGYGWISPEYVAGLWESLPGRGTKEWNVNIAIKVYQKLIDEDLLYEEDEDEPGEQGKKIETVDEAIESAGEYGSFE